MITNDYDFCQIEEGSQDRIKNYRREDLLRFLSIKALYSTIGRVKNQKNHRSRDDAPCFYFIKWTGPYILLVELSIGDFFRVRRSRRLTDYLICGEVVVSQRQ